MTFLPFIPGGAELRPFVAELWLIATIVAVLLTPFFVRRPNSACALVSLAGLVGALISLVVVRPDEAVATQRFATMLTADGVAFFWKVLLLLFVIGVVLLWFITTASSMHEGDGPEFFTLLLGATLGMALMGSASNLLMLFLAVESASLPSYVLAGFRKSHRVGAEASLKYVLFGAATSAVMAYGLSLLYGLYGTLNLYSFDTAAGHVPGLAELVARQGVSPALLAIAMTGLIVGVGFKISAVPFHFWCPDVFEGATIDVTTFLSVASKGAGLVLLLRVLSAFAAALAYHPSGVTTALAIAIGILGAITCTVGNTAAYVQGNIKRLLAYSSIAHAGYMLCAASLLFLGHSARTQFIDPAAAASQAVLMYLAVYLFMNLGAFTVAGMIAKQTGTEQLSGYAGLGRRSPILAACMTVFMLSLIGLPPFAGFVVKVNLLWVLMQNGGWWWALVGVIGANTVLSLYYYARVLRAMYLERESGEQPTFIGNPLGLAMSAACAAVLLLLFVAWGPLDRLTKSYSRFTAQVPVALAPAAAMPGSAPTTAPATTAPAPAAPAPVAAAR